MLQCSGFPSTDCGQVGQHGWGGSHKTQCWVLWEERDTLEDAELKHWVAGGCCSDVIRTATLGKATEMLNLRAGSDVTLALS